MTATDIQIGESYWLQEGSAPARAAMVLKRSKTELLWFQCYDPATGEAFFAFGDAFQKHADIEVEALFAACHSLGGQRHDRKRDPSRQEILD